MVLPVFNDWKSLSQLVDEIAVAYSERYEIHLLIVDDGSTDVCLTSDRIAQCDSTEVVHLGSNLGHQRAICVGLVRLSTRSDLDAVLVMDSDGEDSVLAVHDLVTPILTGRSDVAVAQRTTRSEGMPFRIFYRLYKLLFRLLTGERLDFGNFSAMSLTALNRLVYSPDLWNHYPCAVMKSRLAVEKIPVAREDRYCGRSKMDLTALTTHGLSGLSVFVDRIFVRLLMLTGLVGFVLLTAVALGIAARLVLQVPIAGWLALGTTAAFIALIQVLSTLAVLAFVSLSMRSRFSPPPNEFAQTYARTIANLPNRDQDD